MHTDQAEANRQHLKNQFLEAFGSGTVAMKVAAERVGKDTATIWKWRQVDPAFDAAVLQAQEDSDGVRVAMVEDSMFARIVAGKASPAETIFFLKNRAPERWKDTQYVKHTGLVALAQRLQGMTDAELEQLIHSPDDHIAGLLVAGEQDYGVRRVS